MLLPVILAKMDPNIQSNCSVATCFLTHNTSNLDVSYSVYWYSYVLLFVSVSPVSLKTAMKCDVLVSVLLSRAELKPLCLNLLKRFGEEVWSLVIFQFCVEVIFLSTLAVTFWDSQKVTAR